MAGSLNAAHRCRVNPDGRSDPGPGGKRIRVSVPAFALGVFEVTNDQFARFVEDSGYEVPGGLVDAHNTSLVLGKGKGGKPSGDEERDRTVVVGTTTLHGGLVADEVTVDWYHAGSQSELRTMAISVSGDTRGRITLYVTGSRWHDWEDLRRLAHTLRVDR